jgi:hypothetical protein
MVPPSPIGAGPQLPPKFVFRPGLKSRMNQRRGVEAARTDYQCFKNWKEKKCWLLLPGASEPRLRSLNRRASSFGLSRYIKQREQPEQSYRLQLEISPKTSEPSRAKNQPLHSRRSCFAPRRAGFR